MKIEIFDVGHGQCAVVSAAAIIKFWPIEQQSCPELTGFHV
jgi:hypothetical protein